MTKNRSYIRERARIIVDFAQRLVDKDIIKYLQEFDKLPKEAKWSLNTLRTLSEELHSPDDQLTDQEFAEKVQNAGHYLGDVLSYLTLVASTSEQ